VIGVAAFVMKGGQSLNFAIPVELVTALIRKTESDAGLSRGAKPFPLAKKEISSNSINPLADLRAVRAYADYFQADDNTSTLKRAKAIMARSPQDPIAYYLLASALDSISFFDEALNVVNDGLKIDSSEPLLWWRLGVIQGHQQRHAEAAAAYRKAISLNPNFHGAWSMLGHSLISQDKGWEAVEAMRAALNLKPDEASGWACLGDAYSSAGMASESVAAYNKAIEIDPKYVSAWTSLAREQAKSKDYQSAEISYRKALEADPNDYMALDALITLYWKLGQRAKFDELAPSYRRVAPRNIPWLESLTWEKPIRRAQSKR
jgi:tetratricopeptide (TPR) repeat protein